ncbi:hypothetical protein B0T16DRAFT_489089 [Cercophora newfieldiana]|uniref:Rho-GAP domain-containing protein n=1 Tax=Cercophora newfieldiana TaxID=92897 RepID=A0AA39YT25_9PEZI|nr:hypothetical protein B0T16DRAFT_489089 [Cercophora newfieldiana]
MATRSAESMDWITINTGCFAASGAISRTLLSTKRFVRQVRESRAELDDVCTLLHSLDNVLDLLKDDAADFPPQLGSVTPRLLEGCQLIINELDGCIAVLGRDGVSRLEKKSRWISSREQIGKLCGMLYGYRDILGLAVDLIALTHPGLSRNIKDVEAATDERIELEAVTARIEETSGHLAEDAPQNSAFAILRWYLDTLHAHAVASLESEPDQSHHQHTPVEEPPDSAIEISDEQPLPPKRPSSTVPSQVPNLAAEDLDELLDELCEMPVVLPNRPPTPPPRSRARSVGSHHTSVSDGCSRASGSISDYSGSSNSSSIQPTLGVPGHRRDWSYALSQVSNISDTSYSTGQSPITEGVRSDCDESQPQVLSSVWSDDSAAASTRRPSTSETASSSDKRPPGRRSSFRLASAFKGFHIRRNSKTQTIADAPEDPNAPPPAIFGTPLSISIPIARGVAGTRHKRGGSSSQEYPLCMLRCVYFLREAGISAPDIFDQPSDPVLLAQLKFIFSSPETSYGRDLNWAEFSVYEAADLILMFLSELPQPLVPESVAKRWIKLSRQATISGSLALRLDQGLDFWEEAFAGLKGPARALFKLLLNLWGEIADAADANDMTAERLAGRVVRPLMHGGNGGAHDTDMLLGVAFMIRKRSEYNVSLRGGGKSKAAF